VDEMRLLSRFVYVTYGFAGPPKLRPNLRIVPTASEAGAVVSNDRKRQLATFGRFYQAGLKASSPLALT